VFASRAFRIAAIVAGAVVALVAIAAAVIAVKFDAAAIARHATAEVSRATGRTIAVGGEVELAWWPRLGVVAHGVTVSNPPGASRPEMARIAVARGAIATWPLIARREVVIDRVELDGLDLALETLPGGQGNWVIDVPAAAEPAPRSDAGAPASGRVTLAGPIEVARAVVSYRPAGATAPMTFSIEQAAVRPAADGQFHWNAKVDHDTTLWTIEATTGDPIVANRGRVPLVIDLKADGGGVAVTAKGRVERRDSGPGLAVDATLAWKAGSPRMARWSPGLAASDGNLGARVEAETQRVTLDGIAGAWGGSRVDGTLALAGKGKVPSVKGRLHADRIDLSRLASTAAPAEPVPAAVPATPPSSPLGRLASFDADLDFVVDRLVLPLGLEVTNARGRAVVAGGKLVADPLDADLGGGTIGARVTADAGTDRARVVAQARDVELSRVGRLAIAGRQATGGRTTSSIDLSGPARSFAAFRAGASGTIRVDVGTMRVEGIALDAGGEVFARLADAVNPFRRVDPYTELRCFVARLAVRDGIAASERTIALETSRLAASASGTIDLGRETLDLLVRPRSRGGLGIASIELAELVRVSGPWRNPAVKLDKVAAARTAITVGSAIASGGWSLLATPLLGTRDDPNPCATARAGGEIAAQAREPASAPATTQPDPVEALRRLFKR